MRQGGLDGSALLRQGGETAVAGSDCVLLAGEGAKERSQTVAVRVPDKAKQAAQRSRLREYESAVLVFTLSHLGGDARRAPACSDDVAWRSAPRWSPVCPQLQVQLRSPHPACYRSSFVSILLTNSKTSQSASCAHPCLCCAPAPAQLRPKQPGLALLSTFQPSQSASFIHRERQPSHVPRPSFRERDFLLRHALSRVQPPHRRTTHRLRRQKHDLTATKCHHMSSHLHAKCARHDRRIGYRSKAITREPY